MPRTLTPARFRAHGRHRKGQPPLSMGEIITREIERDPAEVALLRRRRADAREGKYVSWGETSTSGLPISDKALAEALAAQANLLAYQSANPSRLAWPDGSPIFADHDEQVEQAHRQARERQASTPHGY